MVLLPRCRCCGSCGCVFPTVLPYTVTVEFSGLKNKTHSPHCNLLFLSNFGSGAAGVVMAPGGTDYWDEPDNPDEGGPLTEVLLTQGGSGYAKIGRVEPTLTIEAATDSDEGGGTGATFTPVLSLKHPDSPCPSWTIESVQMTGGTDYSVGEQLKVSHGNAEVVTPAVLLIASGRESPNVTASVSGGSGATISPEVQSNDDKPETWSVAAVEVIDPGSGYSDGQQVTFTTATGVTTERQAVATITTRREQPSATASLPFSGGAGAVLSVLLSETTGESDNRPCWFATGFVIHDGGAGYITGDFIQVQFDENASACFGGTIYGEVGSVDENGSILSADVSAYGGYYIDNGEIQSVQVEDGGSYYLLSGEGTEVKVFDGGEYYLEDKDAEPCVAGVDITASGEESGAGACGCTGAVIEATIGTDPYDPDTFGKITGLTIVEPGDDCLAWEWAYTHHKELNGVPIVLAAVDPKRLITVSVDSCFGSGAELEVSAVGERSEPDITFFTASGEGGEITATLLAHTDDAGLEYWSIESVAASGGTGYYDGETAAVAEEPCLVIEEPASITIAATDGVLTGATVASGGKYYHRPKYDGLPGPLREVEVTNGGGGYAVYGREEPQWWVQSGDVHLTPTFSEQTGSCGRPTWTIDSVEITQLGEESAFSDNVPILIDSVGFQTKSAPIVVWSDPARDKTISAAMWRVRTRRDPPSDSMIAASASRGDGAEFSFGWQSSGSPPDVTYSMTGASGSGGAGYRTGDAIVFTAIEGSEAQGIAPAVGTIVATAEGAIQSVQLTAGGSFWVQTTSPESVIVDRGGSFYTENPELPAITAEVSVRITQQSPGAGSGAEIEVTIGDDPSVPADFGKILSAAVVDGGEAYEILGAPRSCQYRHGLCDPVFSPFVSLSLDPSLPPELTIFDDRGTSNYTVLRSSDPHACDFTTMDFTLLHGAQDGVSATVTRGGAAQEPCDPPEWCDIAPEPPGCGCCEDDYFYESGVSDDFVYLWTRYLTRITPSFPLVRKSDAPERDCLDNLFVYYFSIGAGDVELCNFRYRIRVYVPDCDSETLIDITSDYEEPALAAYAYERVDFWEWGYPEKGDGYSCEWSDYSLRDWPPLPECNPIP